MAMTNDAGAGGADALLRSHGITRDPRRSASRPPTAPWYYEQQVLGFNYRMTDMQAALGLSQLQRLDAVHRRRHRHRRRATTSCWAICR